MKERVTQLIGDLKSANYCCHRIIRLNQELEELNHKMLGLSHNHPRLSAEQERSDLPMPVFHGGYTSPIAMLEEERLLEQEIFYYRRRLNECKPIELLSMNDQNILFDLYFFKMKQEDVAEKYGYTRRGLHKHLTSTMKMIF